MPEHLLCEACKAVAFQFTKAFVWTYRYNRESMLKETELLDLTGMELDKLAHQRSKFIPIT